MTYDDLLMDVPGKPATDGTDWTRAFLDAAKRKYDAWIEEQNKVSREERIRGLAEDSLERKDAAKLAEQLQAERSGANDSWQEEDTDELFDSEQQRPDIGSFIESELSNGGGIFYSGKVNEIHGPSESGKTMVALAVAAQEVRAGNHVIMIDFEDDGRSIVNRLRWVFGLEREEIKKRFHYFRPDVAFNEQAMAYIEAIQGVTLCIIDAVTEGMSIAQLDGRNENEVATWYNEFPKRLASLGMGVCLVDHTPQDNHNRQIGSQHKKSAVNGVSYTAEPMSPFVKGGRGHLRLKVAKDKPGGIRPAALPQGDGKQYWRGDFKIDGSASPDSPHVGLHGVDPHAFEIGRQGQGSTNVEKPDLPPAYLAPTLTALAYDGEWMGCRALGEAIGLSMDPKSKERTQPRNYAVRLLKLGMVERKMVGTTVMFKISGKGLHSANAWASRTIEDAQMSLGGASHETTSETK